MTQDAEQIIATNFADSIIKLVNECRDNLFIDARVYIPAVDRLIASVERYARWSSVGAESALNTAYAARAELNALIIDRMQLDDSRIMINTAAVADTVRDITQDAIATGEYRVAA